MTKKLYSIVCILLLVSVIVACGGDKSSSGGSGKEETSIRIGFIGPMTGDYANYGTLMSQAVTIAVDEWNENGGIDGKEIKFFIEDSQGTLEKGQAAIEKLVSINKIQGLVGCVFTGVSLGVGPRAQAEKLVMISPSTTHADFTGIGDYLFRTVPSDGLQAEVAGRYFYEELGVRKLAILYVKNDYSQGLSEGVTRVFENAGGEVVLVETASSGDKDFRTQLTNIKSANPDALYIPNYVAEAAQILEQAADLGLNVQMLSADGFTNTEIFSLAGNYTTGVIYTGTPEESITDLRSSFQSTYKSRFGVDPDAFSLNAYDGATILLKAIEASFAESGSYSPEFVRDYVAAASFEGVSGNVSFFDNGDRRSNIGIFRATDVTGESIGVYSVDADGNLASN